MNKKSQDLRIAYVKAGDVVAELKEAVGCEKLPDGGPNAYTHYFYKKVVSGRKALIVSHFSQASEFTYSINDTTAQCLPGEHLSSVAQLSLIRLLLQFRPHIILCSMYDLNLLSVVMCALYLRIGYIVICHNRITHGRGSLKSFLKDTLNILMIRRARGVVCHGPYLKAQAKKIGLPKEKIFEFNWRIKYLKNHDKLESLFDLTEKGSKKIILFLGRLTYEKGVFDLYKAIRDRLIEDKSVKLVYAGTGKEQKKLEKCISKLTNRAISIGPIKHENLGSLIRQAHVVVTPTRSSFPEGLCKVINESYIFGKPVIGPRFGPFTILIKDKKTGMLYEPDSIEDLKKKIIAVIDDDRLHAMLSLGAKEQGKKVEMFDCDFSDAIDQALSLAF
jgi:glycosyltransferase involved in cell wall biosynthesis